MLSDGIRKSFTKDFYRSLFVDKTTVKEAFDLAVTFVSAKTCAKGVTFHLFPAGELGGVKFRLARARFDFFVVK